MTMCERTNFLDLPAEQSDFASARYVVLPVPFEQTVSYKSGTAGGPAAIIEASAQVELLDEEFLAEFVACGIATLDAVTPTPTASGDWPVLYPGVRDVMAAGKFLLALGGEHSKRHDRGAERAAHHPGHHLVARVEAEPGRHVRQ
mgnify:CR=1 FL=1